MSSELSPEVSPPSAQNWNLWKWYFAIMFVLTLAATGSLWLFNLKIQLTREELAAQHELWMTQRPGDYFLSYLRVNDDAENGFVYKVDVRGGQVTRAEEFEVRVRERREIDPSTDDGRLLGAEEAQRHSMDALHQLAATIMDDDGKQQRRVYVRARFHSENGAILEFVRRLMGSRERTQINVLAFRFGPDLEN